MSSAAERLSRLLDLVPWLMAHPGVTIAEAANHFGVSADQLERDLDLLIVSGRPGYFPDDLVDIQYWDEGNRIHVLEPQGLDRPRALTVGEAARLLVGLRLLAQIPGAHDRDAIRGALSALEQAAGPVADVVSHADVRVSTGETAEHLGQAIQRRCAIRIRHHHGSTGEVSERVVDPIAVVSVGGHVYLEAWCRSAEAMRTFRADRIEHVDLLPEPAAPPHSEAHLIRDALLTPDGPTVRVWCAPEASWLQDAPGAVVEHRDADGCVIALPVRDPIWLVRLALQHGGAMRLLDAALAQEVHRRASAALAD